MADPRAPRHSWSIGHGVTSHWDRPWQTELSAALGSAGLASVLVSFAGNGASEGRFEDVTPTKEAADLGSVLDALETWGVHRLAYAGHSMGGAVGVLRASIDPRIEALVSLAGMFHVHAFMQRTFGHLPYGGLMLDKPGCLWNAALEDDGLRLGSLEDQAAAVRVPWLLVHGDADELVPLQDRSTPALRPVESRSRRAARRRSSVHRGDSSRVRGRRALAGAAPGLIAMAACRSHRGSRSSACATISA